MARELIDNEPDIISNWEVSKSFYHKIKLGKTKKFRHPIIRTRISQGYRIDMCASASKDNCPKCNIRTSCPVYNATKQS